MTNCKLILHLVAVSSEAFGLWYDYNFVTFPISIKNDITFLRGRVKYLTMWNLLLQALFFTLCFLNDVIGNNELAPKKPPILRKIVDIMLPALAFPLSMFVGITFWAIYFVDRELIFPRALDAFFPGWLNHVMHTNIMLFILLEMLTSYRKYPRRKTGIAILLAFKLTYLVWINIIYFNTGAWVYPILDVLNWPLRVVFFLALFGLALILYLAGEKLNKLMWSKQQPMQQKIK